MVGVASMARLAARLVRAVRADLSACRFAIGSQAGRRSALLLAYEFRRGEDRRRVHLRLGADGSGVLLVDAADAVHLNATAALLARLALEGMTPHRAARVLRRRFHGLDAPTAADHVADVFALVERLREPGDGCPTCHVPATIPLFSRRVGAPYKADVALTYRCNNACGHCYNPPRRCEGEELDPASWRRVLRRLEAVGIPHVVFTGGEPTLVPCLPELVAEARRLRLVTGLNTNGRRLADRRLVAALGQAGLEHVQITFESHLAVLHNAMTGADSFDETLQGIRNCVAAGLHTITNTTLTRRNAATAETTLDFLAELGLRAVAFNGMIHAGRGRRHPDALAEDQLGPLLDALRRRALARGLRLLWYTPTAWCRFSPVEYDLGPRRCNAAEYSFCVEPNGDVLPCQSYYEPVGNLLRDPWEQLWHSALFERFRGRVDDPRAAGLPEACCDCPDLPLCAGGCPLARGADEATPSPVLPYHRSPP